MPVLFSMNMPVLFSATLNHNQQRNKEKTVMSFYAHLLKTPNRHAGAFGVFHASQTKKPALAGFKTQR